MEEKVRPCYTKGTRLELPCPRPPVGGGRKRESRSKLTIMPKLALRLGQVKLDEAGDEKEGNCEEVDAQTVAEGFDGEAPQARAGVVWGGAIK